jgi:class 3 adenylate cyclase/tetratricopeptide (TPR) repeat protein
MSDIRDWLAGLGLAAHAAAFEAEEVDLETLRALDDADLKELGLPLGPRRKILREIETAAPTAGLDMPRPAYLARPAERRQITVMFCDLVGSTRLSQSLDPEVLRDVMHAYRSACDRVITTYDGHVAQYLGDGIMVYFGWPQAHEDDAQRAVQAALDIVGAVSALDAAATLAVRIGIATGNVVVGDSQSDGHDDSHLAVGDTPNLAARIQGVAETNRVVIGDSTRRLVGGAFELDSLGAIELKGVDRAVEVHNVVREASGADRFHSRAVGGLTPFVGRQAEATMLVERWHQAKDGEGQAVLLGGEPGIGKSRITQELHERLATEPHGEVRYQCSAYHSNTAFHPLIVQLTRMAGFASNDDTESKLDKLEVALARGSEDWRQAAPLFAAMMSLPTDRYPPLSLPAQKQKDDTIAAIAEHVIGLARHGPILILFEDAHWCDPTTLEALGAIIDRLQATPVLLLLTFRPEFTAPWPVQGHVTTLSLNRLGRQRGHDMVRKVSAGAALPDDVADQIIAKADGVPLFIEELTKTVMESGRSAGLTIPSTLQDSLMARLDRLAPAREVAQLGACLGREFSYETLVAVATVPEEKVRDALDQLVGGDLIFRSAGSDQTTYTFKHALVQDAAYQSLLMSTRREFHLRIAQTLALSFPHLVEQEPEDIARHYGAAGDLEHALPLWLKAGDQALATYANLEALRVAEAGLGLLEDAPERGQFAHIEIALSLRAAAALRILDRYEDAFEKLDRAEGLCVANGIEDALPAIHTQRGNLYFPRGLFKACRAEHEKALAAARQTGRADDEVRALSGLGDAAYAIGRIRSSRDHFAAAIALCDHHPEAGSGLAERAMLSVTQFYAGDLEAMRRTATETVVRARESGDLRTEMLSLQALCYYHYERDDNLQALANAEAARQLAHTIGSPRFEGESIALKAQSSPGPALELWRDALAFSRRDAMAYIGPMVLVNVAMRCGGAAESASLLAEAEVLLAGAAISHNHLWYHRTRIEWALKTHDWPTAKQHADLLEAYTVAEPVTWAQFHIDLARAFASISGQDQTESGRRTLDTVRQHAGSLGFARVERLIRETSTKAGLAAE